MTLEKRLFDTVVFYSEDVLKWQDALLSHWPVTQHIHCSGLLGYKALWNGRRHLEIVVHFSMTLWRDCTIIIQVF